MVQRVKRVKLPAPHSFTRAEDAELIGYFRLALSIATIWNAKHGRDGKDTVQAREK